MEEAETVAAAESESSGVDKIGAALAAVDGAIAATLIADSAAAAVTAERLLRLRDSLNELLTCTLTGQRMLYISMIIDVLYK